MIIAAGVRANITNLDLTYGFPAVQNSGNLFLQEVNIYNGIEGDLSTPGAIRSIAGTVWLYYSSVFNNGHRMFTALNVRMLIN